MFSDRPEKSVEPEYLPTELVAFRDYWTSEGKVFTQIQWEQKFARHVNHVRAKAKPASRGENHAEIQPDSTASRAVQQIRALAKWTKHVGNGFSIPPVRRQLAAPRHPAGPTPAQLMMEEFRRRKAAGRL